METLETRLISRINYDKQLLMAVFKQEILMKAAEFLRCECSLLFAFCLQYCGFPGNIQDGQSDILSVFASTDPALLLMPL